MSGDILKVNKCVSSSRCSYFLGRFFKWSVNSSLCQQSNRLKFNLSFIHISDVKEVSILEQCYYVRRSVAVLRAFGHGRRSQSRKGKANDIYTVDFRALSFSSFWFNQLEPYPSDRSSNICKTLLFKSEKRSTFMDAFILKVV